jgi:hypothetical protein
MTFPVTLQIMAVPQDRDYGDPLKNAMRLKKGDLIAAYDTLQQADWDEVEGEYRIKGGISATSPFYYIHMLECPYPHTQVNGKIVRALTEFKVDDADTMIRRAAFRVQYETLPQSLKDKMVAEKELTGQFLAIKSFVGKKNAPVTLDTSQDVEQPMVDGDLEAVTG